MKGMINMAKKILLLSASPRKGGNSDLLCDQFIRGAGEAGNQVEKIFLRDRKINYCTGCGACRKNGGKCVQKDDMAEVLDKMIAADVIVMATPVYFYTMNAQMKTLIDRTCARYSEIRNKDFYFIVAAADTRKRAMEHPGGVQGVHVLSEPGKREGCCLWHRSLEEGRYQEE